MIGLYEAWRFKRKVSWRTQFLHEEKLAIINTEEFLSNFPLLPNIDFQISVDVSRVQKVELGL